MKTIGKVVLAIIGIASVVGNLVQFFVIGALASGLEKEKNMSTRDVSELVIRQIKGKK